MVSGRSECRGGYKPEREAIETLRIHRIPALDDPALHRDTARLGATAVVEGTCDLDDVLIAAFY